MQNRGKFSLVARLLRRLFLDPVGGEAATTMEAPTLVPCPTCDKEVAWTAKSCPNCGHRHPGKPSDATNITWAVIGAVAAIAIVVTVILLSIQSQHQAQHQVDCITSGQSNC